SIVTISPTATPAFHTAIQSRFPFIVLSIILFLLLFFFNDTATTEIYTLSLHDALPILAAPARVHETVTRKLTFNGRRATRACTRSEEHTSELQSRGHLVCRLLLEKKKKTNKNGESTEQPNTG